MKEGVIDSGPKRTFEGKTCLVSVEGGMATVTAKPGMESQALLRKRHLLLKSLRELGPPSGTLIPKTYLVRVGDSDALQYEFVEGRNLNEFLSNCTSVEAEGVSQKLSDLLTWLHGLPDGQREILRNTCQLPSPERNKEFLEPDGSLAVLLSDLHGDNILVTDSGDIAFLDVNDACMGDVAAEFRKMFRRKRTRKFAFTVLRTYLGSVPVSERRDFLARLRKYARAYGDRKKQSTALKQT